jgi:hypothetical protein
MTLMRIRLELARTADYPDGSAIHGYEFIAPRDGKFHIDAQQWNTLKDQCLVTRLWGEAPQEEGRLRHVGHGWRFDYAGGDDTDDEPFLSSTGMH